MGDVIEALLAVDALVRDAVSVMPSLIEGLRIEECSLNVRSLTQESPLRELFFISIFLAFQEELEREVPMLLEDIFDIAVSDKYDTIVTVAFLAVAFYGAGLAVDAARKAFSDSLPRAKFEELVQVLALETGKAPSDVRTIIEARFAKPAPAKRLVSAAKRLFIPSQRDKNAAVVIDRDRVPSEVIREIPYPKPNEAAADFDRFTPYHGVELDLHAQDRDRAATGWAAVASSISPERLKVRVMDPVQPGDLWGQDKATADIVLVSKLTSNGYVPSEIQITSLHSKVEVPPPQLPSGTATKKRQRIRPD